MRLLTLLKPSIYQAKVFNGTRFTGPVVHKDTVRLGMTVHMPRIENPEARELLEQFFKAGKGVEDFSDFIFQSVEHNT